LRIPFNNIHEWNIIDTAIWWQGQKGHLRETRSSSKHRKKAHGWLWRIFYTSGIIGKRKKKKNVARKYNYLSEDASKWTETHQIKWKIEARSYNLEVTTKGLQSSR